MTPTPLTEKERDIARILRMMMGSDTDHDECTTYMAPEYAAVWEKMKNGSE